MCPVSCAVCSLTTSPLLLRGLPSWLSCCLTLSASPPLRLHSLSWPAEPKPWDDPHGHAGSPPHLPPVRRRMDVHRQKPDVQDGVERARLRAENQDRRLQERRRHRGREEVGPRGVARWRRPLPPRSLVFPPPFTRSTASLPHPLTVTPRATHPRSMQFLPPVYF